MRVKARRSANSTAISRSMPWPGLTCARTSRGPAPGGQQRHDLEIVARPQLAGEAHAAVGGADPGQHPGFVGGRRRQMRGALADPHPAGRAAPAAAAHRCMRDADRAARLEHAHAGRDRDLDPARIAQPDQAAIALAQRAQPAAADRGQQHHAEAQQHLALGPVDPGPSRPDRARRPPRPARRARPDRPRPAP